MESIFENVRICLEQRENREIFLFIVQLFQMFQAFEEKNVEEMDPLFVQQCR